jgi:hypothetical protein
MWTVLLHRILGGLVSNLGPAIKYAYYYYSRP